jgi:hypothetical protein
MLSLRVLLIYASDLAAVKVKILKKLEDEEVGLSGYQFVERAVLFGFVQVQLRMRT